MTVERYPNLLSPGAIGKMELRNRIFQTAMGTNLANPDGTISDDSVAFYAARAAGGAALLTMGAAGVSYPRGQVQPNQFAVSDDRFIPGLKLIADAVHRHGGKLSAQLHHGGLTAVFDTLRGHPLACPSRPLSDAPAGLSMFATLFPSEIAIPTVEGGPSDAGQQYEELNEDGIRRLIGDFADGAVRAAEAGFDAVEVHAGHSYILSSFLSPVENRRTDGYGGSADNRARLVREVIEAVRARLGREFPVLCKINAAEFFVGGGLTLDDVRTTARIIEAAGADAITVTTIHNCDVGKALLSSYIPDEPGKLIPYAAAVKEAVSIPVVTVGRIEPEVGDRAIAEGKFDFMAMGRKLIADAEFARHLADGGRTAVRPCIYDYRCLSSVMMLNQVRCAANPDAGRETEDLLIPAPAARRAVVVGGGPAGMEAARRLSLRGHSVTLFEAGERLGGKALLAARLYEPNGLLVEWLAEQLREQHVDVRFNTFATPESIQGLAPDVVLLAVGEGLATPRIDGKDLPHVVHGASLPELLLGADGIRSDRIVIIGNDLIALQLAWFLRDSERVDVVDAVPQFGWGIAPARRAVLLEELAEASITLHRNASSISVEPEAVTYEDSHVGVVRLPADTVIVTGVGEPNRDLYNALREAGTEVHLIGDSGGRGYIYGALHTAAEVCATI